MKKRFKAKRRYYLKIKYIIYILIILIVLVIFLFGARKITKINISNSNDEFITYMLNDSNHYIKYGNLKIGKKIIKLITNIDLENPVSIIKTSFNDYSTELVYEDNYDKEIKKTVYVENPNLDNTNNPKVYIYNSHQLENYKTENVNTKPNVLMASYIFEEQLEKYNIPTLVEETNMTEFMNSNNWQHKDSYIASRYLVKDALEKHKDLELLIDLHRDSIKYNNSTITINEKKYARVLFVVGTEYSSYKTNLELANNFNSLINNKYPNLSRGVITKSGANVNGVYNQDLSSKILLLECGGYENSIDEVSNTIEVLSEIIKNYLEV